MNFEQILGQDNEVVDIFIASVEWTKNMYVILQCIQVMVYCTYLASLCLFRPTYVHYVAT